MIVALAGGVGGAKLADGLMQVLGERLAVIVNTGDDFRHLGLAISPDVDTVLYTLAGIANPTTGWGIRDETWSFLKQLGMLGGETWFQLGDRDVALHVLRTHALAAGERLTTVTDSVRRRLGVPARILPMTDALVATIVDSDEGSLAFQDYFVRRRCQPVVRGFRFAGIKAAEPTPEVHAALSDPHLEGIVICPSNPYVSVDPILAVPGLQDMIASSGVPVVAVSPIIGGEAVKGPAAKMMRELGYEVSVEAVARHYSGLISGIVLDVLDADLAPAIGRGGVQVATCDTLMREPADRRRVAEAALSLLAELRRAR
jgi:LPPG:FO 2-phospho-L-lactate transferase